MDPAHLSPASRFNYARWFRFAAVGLMGILVQLTVLQILVRLRLNYLLATALAVEAALLHNYVWHRRWTWVERASVATEKPSSPLLRFHIANGLISLISNLLWMRLLTGGLAMAPLPANLLAIAATAILNFALADRWVFAK